MSEGQEKIEHGIKVAIPEKEITLRPAEKVMVKEINVRRIEIIPSMRRVVAQVLGLGRILIFDGATYPEGGAITEESVTQAILAQVESGNIVRPN